MDHHDLALNFEEVSRLQESEGSKFLSEILKLYQAHAREEAPVRTGALMRSIALDPIGLIADVHYATYVHDGTSKMEANPFFHRALSEDHMDIKRKISEEEVRLESKLAK